MSIRWVQLEASLVPRPSPRFYLTAAEENTDFSPHLQGKIWEWPGDEASLKLQGKIWEWPGNEANLNLGFFVLQLF